MSSTRELLGEVNHEVHNNVADAHAKCSKNTDKRFQISPHFAWTIIECAILCHLTFKRSLDHLIGQATYTYCGLT